MIENINGMNVYIDGDGFPLLFLHGYLSSKESFAYQTQYLKKYFKCIAPDMVGFGGQKMPYPFTLDDYKNSINQLIDQLNIEKTHVLCHSFGARVLLKMLPQNKKIDKVVLTGPAGLKPKFSLNKKLKLCCYKFFKNVLKIDISSKTASHDYKMLDGVMKQSFIKIINEHLDYKLEKINNEVLLIFGENDGETPLYYSKRFLKGLKNSRLEIIKEAGHFAFIDKPNQFNILVKEFLL